MAKPTQSTLTKQQQKLERIKDKLYKAIDIHQGLVSAIIVMEDGKGSKSEGPERENLAIALKVSYLELDHKIIKLLNFAKKLTTK